MLHELAPIVVDDLPGAGRPDPVWERIFQAEGDLQQQAQNLAAIQGSLNKLQETMTRLIEVQGVGKPANMIPTETGVVGGGRSRVRPAAPPDFDGSREKGQAFLNDCLFYFY